MLSSQGRHASAPRRHYESDSDRPRQTMTSTQRYTNEHATGTAVPDRSHRSSRRPDTSGNTLAFESAPPASKHSSSRDHSFARGPSHYTPPEAQAWQTTAASGSRPRAHDQSHDPDIYAYARRRTDKQSPRSSQEKIPGMEQGKSSRTSQQPRGGYQSTTPVQPSGAAYAASSQYVPFREPASSSKHRLDRDKAADEEKERRRKERRQEKDRLRALEEQLRERAAMEELEKQRRREERRAEREREKERERRREEKELERARRHREKAKEYESRARDEARAVNPVYPNASLLSSKYQNSTDQVPSSSSNIALPFTQQVPSASTRPQATTDPRRDNIMATPSAPPQVPEKERKRRSHRDKVLAQQAAQDSGLSSSEQEQGRERLREKRHALRDTNGDAHYSGPSGSENERGPGYESRRRHKGTQDPYATLRANANVSSSMQHSAPVGSSQRYSRQIVSIRAGQGPADVEPPPARSKTPFAVGQGRPRDVGSTSMQMQSSGQSGQPPYLDAASQQQARTLNHRPSQNSMNRGYATSAAAYPGYPHQAVQQGSAPTYSAGGPGMPSYQPPAPRETALGVEGILPNPAYQSSTPAVPPSAPMPAPTAPPRSSPAHHQQYLPPKPSHSTPPTKSADPFPRPDNKNVPGHHARISVYDSSHHATSAEFFVPGTQPNQTHSVTVNSATMKDLAARFPLNEDVLTSASSSTLNAGTNRSDQGAAAAAQFAPGVSAIPSRGPNPPNWPSAEHRHAAQPENDVPIPIPYPRFTTPSFAPPAASTAYQPAQSTRPTATPLQPKSSPMPPQGYVPAQTMNNASPVGKAAPVSSHYNHSPLQGLQQPPQRSPSTLNGIPLASGGTPKQSPSMRLKTRNGSTDTVVYVGAKASPSHSGRHITHRTSNGNLQAQSRPETNPSRPQPAPPEYPDISRYRPQPAGYPAPNPTATYLPPTTNQPNESYSQSTSHAHHSRSASQPIIQNPAYDSHSHAQRTQTMPAAMPSHPAAAPSASAIAAAYRSGAYGSDNAARPQPAADKADRRVPPRAAPSPAPTYPAQQQYAGLPPSALSKTGYALPTNTPQMTRAPPPPAPGMARAAGPTVANHTRSASEPQNMSMSGRVAISGHPSTPAPAKAQLTSPSEEQLLMTPSSLAPSMLKGGSNTTPFPSSRPTPQPVKPTSSKEKEATRKKGGLFGIFRSRSSPPKQDARVAEAVADAPQTKPRQRSISQGTITAVAASVRQIIAPHPQPSRSVPPQSVPTQQGPMSTPRTSGERPRGRTGNDSESVRSRHRRDASPQPQIREPAPRPMRTASELPMQPGANAKVFTPFRLVSSKRYRTVSAASNEADHGTQATSTIIGGESARSSTAGRLSPPIPMQDPRKATQVWINQEEAELVDRGTLRRRRPGVVFDVSEDFTDTETHHSLSRKARKPS